MKGKSNIWRASRAAIDGVTLPELIAVIAITGVLAAIAAPSVSFGREPLQDSTQRVSSVLKLARSKAISQTSAYKVSATAENEIEVERSTSCDSGVWENAPNFFGEELQLDDGVIFSAASQENPVNPDDWSICFNSRGLTDTTLELTLLRQDAAGGSETLQVFRGGVVTIQ